MPRAPRRFLALLLLVTPLVATACGQGNKGTVETGTGGAPAWDAATSQIEAKPDLALALAPDGSAVLPPPNGLDTSAVVSPDAMRDSHSTTADIGPSANLDGPATKPSSGLDTAGPSGTPDASAPPTSATVLESSALRLEITPSPYAYKVTEKSSGEVLISQSATAFTIGGTAQSATSASAFTTTATTLDSTLTLAGSSTTAHVRFTFTSPQVLQVLLTSNGTAPTNIKEQFNDQSEHYYGIWGYNLGASGNLDNRGADHDLLGVQVNPGTNYSSTRAPFYATSKKYGIYAESMAKGHYTIAVGGKTSFNFDAPQLQYDILYGPTGAEILGRYNTLAGPSLLPPLWAFDSIWWRDDNHDDWAAQGVANSQALVIKDADNLRLNQMPASAIWIDRPYGTPQNQSSKAGGWGNMDFDSTFPNPSQMITDLNTRGMKLMLWTANRCLNQLLTEARASNYNFAVNTYTDSPAADLRIPAAYDWFKTKLIKAFVNLGVHGYKIDRGEEGEQPDSAQNENVYLFHKLSYEGMATAYGDDFLSLARDVYDKSRQYISPWSGDSSADFAGLISSIKVGLRASAMNFPIFGSDTGGYNGTPTKEVFARWLEFSTYNPIMEVLNGPKRTVWNSFDSELIAIAKTQTQAHHDLMPYTRSYAYHATQTGVPIMRSMTLAYPNDTSLYDTWNQYMFGGEILVAPITTAGATSRTVYLPTGNWINYNDKVTTSAGGTSITATAPLATIPLFVKEGAIIPRGDILQTNNSWTTSWSANLRIEIFPAATGTSSFDYYTGSATKTITASLSGGTLTVQFDDLGTSGSLAIYCKSVTSVVRNGVTLTSGSDFTYDATKKLLTVTYSGATNLQVAGTAGLF